jgi:hypothetical protein
MLCERSDEEDSDSDDSDDSDLDDFFKIDNYKKQFSKVLKELLQQFEESDDTEPNNFYCNIQ